jgi:tRNA (guanine37-N1)-methyltransferase
MKISILTLFPEMFEGPFGHSIVKRAVENKLLDIRLVNIRGFGLGAHRTVDDTPYGGGRGMVMRVDVLHAAVRSTRDGKLKPEEEKVVLLDARGTPFSQSHAISFSKLRHVILICGHYEGVDERIRSYVDLTISIGDFILTGGEIPAMAVTDAVGRLVSGVLSDEATLVESFSTSGTDKTLLEYPQYTKPREYDGTGVPDILLTGNHAGIDSWRKENAIEITKKHRPDLLK